MMSLLTVPSTSASPAESSVEVNDKVVIVYMNWWRKLLVQTQKSSLIEWADECWSSQTQEASLLEWIDESCWAKPERPAWLNGVMNCWLCKVQALAQMNQVWKSMLKWISVQGCNIFLAVPCSHASLAESNGEVSNVWMKRWIFWRCHAQAPARLNQAIELMIFSGVMNLLAESSQQGQPDWLMWWYDESIGWVKSKRPACLNDEMNPLAGLSPEKSSLRNWVDWSCWTKPWPCQVQSQPIEWIDEVLASQVSCRPELMRMIRLLAVPCNGASLFQWRCQMFADQARVPALQNESQSSDKDMELLTVSIIMASPFQWKC